jgi:hypothetical protein
MLEEVSREPLIIDRGGGEDRAASPVQDPVMAMMYEFGLKERLMKSCADASGV